ncbi:TadE/TadG family type IV pilus assembly protein [Pseudovibrio sp. SCP19]|uniref:TadE/TadG family type IV pilus assembly protein n=1 Tax=Pseudovibrio sp. SCP19 TaxID=3141374 RepID=UPI00333853D4
MSDCKKEYSFVLQRLIKSKILIGKFAKNARGVTAVEFAIIAPFLLGMVMAILELGLSFLVEVVLDNAVAEASRHIRTGQVFYDAEYDLGKFKKHVLDNGAGLLNAVDEKIFISVQHRDNFEKLPKPEPLLDKDNNVVMQEIWDPGTRNDVVLVQVVCAWPMVSAVMLDYFGVTAGGERLLVATEIFRNEPF